ncbi:helix-turn-helix transcriptional regulator [Myceligenerans salitolerans]|uniref:Helix-turn-helix transcriptional regulator n=1 Tax=Myceligenerans salitolerans TaxID=1230528 RepID=A0ABS3IBD1_9MICO|nr:helix-turn-helix transcriptional regulator [Myceligenerans salitolerans]MBO0610253.1 helix-turn-helix transcriptional regulator [Myceligenerans salitolerans]
MVRDLDADFDVVGLDGIARLVYRYVLSHGTVRPAELAQDVPLGGADGVSVLERLRAAGLVNRAREGNGYTAVDPRTALRTLADRTAARVDRVRSAIPDLAELFEQAGGTPTSGAGVRVVDDPALIGAWYTRLQHEVTKEFLQFDRPPYILADQNPVEPLVLERGVLWRVVYAAEVLDRPGAWEEMRYAATQGERARIARTVPTKLAVADRRIALVNTTLDPRRPTALVVEDQPLVDLLCAAFEAVWEEAVEVPPTDSLEGATPPTRGPTAEDHALLTLLASGATDETIARELGISSRTLRRRSADLLRRLGAANRFQAGVRAAARGWI